MAAPDPLDQPAFTWLQGLLWPSPAGAEVAAYAVLSRGDRPRLVLPLGSRRAAATALTRVTSDESRARVLARRALGATARAGLLLPLLRHRFRSYGGSGSIEVHLAEVLDRARVELAVTIGPPRPNRKPVVQIIEPDGTTIAYAKIGWNGLTRRLVAQEATALQTVDRSALQRLVIPEVVHHGTWNDLELLVLTSIEPGPRETVVLRDPLPQELDELLSLRPSRLAVLESDPYFARLLERARRVGGDVGREITHAARQVVEGLGDAPVRFGGGHGDWSPWNMVATADLLRVWDWERATDAVPIPLDVFHYVVQRAWFRDGVPFPAALEAGIEAARAELRRHGRLEGHAVPLATLYAAELSLRFAENALAGTDELLRSRHEEVRAVVRSGL